MGILTDYENADAVNAALNKGVAADGNIVELQNVVNELKEDLDNIYSKYFSIKDVLEDAEWLCGYSFFDESPYVHTDERYFVNKNAISVRKGTTIINPDTSKYLYAIGFYDKNNDSYINSDYTNAETYAFTTDCYVRIAIKKQDNSTMTQIEMENIIHLFLYDNPADELQDIRVKADGTIAESAGNAVREQFNELKSELYRVSILEDVDWLCGYSFSDNSPYVHTDERYFVSKNKIKVISGNTLKNPDTSKYLYALGFYNDNDSYISSDYTNAETYTFTADCNVRIAIKKQDNSAMTESEMNEIVNEFVNVNTSSIITDLNYKVSTLSNKVDDISPYLYEETVITVGEGGDYSSLKEALDSVSGNSKTKPYVVKVLKGIYDLPSTEKHFGLKNYVRIVGEDKNKCVVRNLYSDTVYDSTRNTFDVEHYGESIEYASVENLTVVCKGGKAPIHIDGGNNIGNIEIKNCILYDMNTLDMTNIPIRSNNYNAGGINVGLLGGRSVKVYDTVSNGIIYAHNQSNQTKPCYFEVNHCQFVCTMWGDLGSGQEDTAVFNDCHFNDLYFGCNSSLTSTKVKTILNNNDIKTVTSYGSDWTDGNGFAGWSQVFGGKCEVIENNIHKQVFNKSTSKITAGSLVQLVNIRGVNLNGLHVEEYDGGLLFGYAMEDIEPNSFGLVQYRNDVEIPLIDGISVGDEIEYTNGTYQKKTTGKTVGYYLGSAPYYRYKMRLNVLN